MSLVGAGIRIQDIVWHARFHHYHYRRCWRL